MNYFISDLHFGHKNCLAFDNRPFKTIEEHDEYIIKVWNETVGIDDDVYILGDISWYNSTKTLEIFKQLNGRLHLIKGNHDTNVLKNPELRKLFVEITDYKELFIDKDTSVVLCHYPIPCFKNHYYGWYGGDTSKNGPWFDEFHRKHPDIPIGCSEYGCDYGSSYALSWIQL